MMLENKVALVTGGTSGIGLGIAERFLKEGAKVVVAGRSKGRCEEAIKKLERISKNRVAFVTGDVSSSKDAKRMISETIEKFDKMDILVNSAGIYLEKRAEETSEEEWDRIIDVDLKGVWLCSVAAYPHFKKQKKGVIINISSDAGISGNRDCAAYCAAKGGVSNLTRAMALDYAKENIRVNALCPAVIDTPMYEMEISRQENREEYMSMTAENHPVGRVGTVEEVAFAALMLASDEAGFTTGACVPVDGGVTAGF